MPAMRSRAPPATWARCAWLAPRPKACGWPRTRCTRDWRGLAQQLRQQLQQALTALRERGDLTRQEAEDDGN